MWRSKSQQVADEIMAILQLRATGCSNIDLCKTRKFLQIPLNKFNIFTKNCIGVTGQCKIEEGGQFLFCLFVFLTCTFLCFV